MIIIATKPSRFSSSFFLEDLSFSICKFGVGDLLGLRYNEINEYKTIRLSTSPLKDSVFCKPEYSPINKDYIIGFESKYGHSSSSYSQDKYFESLNIKGFYLALGEKYETSNK